MVVGRALGTAAGLLAAALAAAPAAVASTDVVTSTSDSGAGSLRAVIGEAASGDTITFASGVTGTIHLTTGEITIGENLTVDGPGAGSLTIDAGGLSRIFDVPNADTVLDISGLTLANGAATNGSNQASGGGINVEDGAQLSVADTVFSHDSAGSTGSPSGGDGGAISMTPYGAPDSSLTISDSTFVDDTAGAADTGGSGGAIAVALYTGGTVDITGSTFERDAANGPGTGGAIFLGTEGAPTGLAVTITNSTFTANTTGSSGSGGAIALEHLASAAPSLTLDSDTVDENSVGQGGSGSAVAGDQSMSATGTIVSGNTGAAECTVAFGSSTDSLEGPDATDTSCGFDLPSANPDLESLADNGGPTETQALGSGSAALDRVPLPDCPHTDQRGFGRPAGSTTSCDVGAFESGQHISATSVTCSPNSVVVGSSTTCTVTVSDTSPTGPFAPTGSVSVESQSCMLAAGANPGTAGCQATVTPSTAGSDTITVSYPGDGDESSSTASTSVVVTPVTPTLTSAASGAVVRGAAVNDTATLAGGVRPSGSISFRLYRGDCSGQTVFTSAPVRVEANDSYTSSAFAPRASGSYGWIAIYSGDANNLAVSSTCARVTVTPDRLVLTAARTQFTVHTVSARCRALAGMLHSCSVSAAAGRTVIARGFSGAQRLTPAGRSLLQRSLGGVRATFRVVGAFTGGAVLRRSRSVELFAAKQLLTPPGGMFAPNSSVLTASGRTFLARVRAQLRRVVAIRCGGHVARVENTSGKPTTAAALSLARGRAACDYLRKLGLRARYTVIGLGAKHQRGNDRTPAGLARNRYVAITVTHG